MIVPPPPAERFRRLGQLFDAAVALPAEERAAFLHEACGGDAELRAELEAMLRADQWAPTLGNAVAGEARQLAGALAPAPPLAPGVRLGRYEIVAPLGSGGMGEVWQARDTRLGRDVAIKVLPRELTADRAALLRFEREARAVAALSHPNILAIHELGREGDMLYAVTELLGGKTLRERLREGAVPARRAREWCAQLARALAAAHDRGIVHRDVKPENVIVTDSGVVKLLDFGIARHEAPLGRMETDCALTAAGVIIGTVGYMAPEQVRGQAVDSRADLFALGCVLYEMLAGKRLFHGPSAVETLRAILDEEPAKLDGLPRDTPPQLARIVRRCLEKRVDDRFQNAHDLAFALGSVDTRSSAEAGGATAALPAPRGVPARRWRRRALLIAAGAAAALLLAGLFLGRRLAPPAALSPVYSSLILTPTETEETVDYSSLALAPDGRTVAFAAIDRGKSRLWVRALDRDEARPLDGTEEASYPFWSPDSRQLAFFADGKLKRIAVDGGPVSTLAPAPNSRGGTWNVDGVIVFAPDIHSGLQRVAATGGTRPQALTRLAVPTSSHRLPRFLPDGRHLLYVVGSDPAGRNGLYHLALDTGRSERILADAYGASFAHGHLLFYREGSLLAQPFDPERGRLRGAPVVIASDVLAYTQRNQVLAALGDRLLLYVPSGAGDSVLTWFDGEGRALRKVGAPGDWQSFELSPDATQVAVLRQDRHGWELWLVDLVDGAQRRLTDVVSASGLAWTPAGDELLFVREPAPGRFELVAVSIDSGKQRILDRSPNYLEASGGWTPDGRTILYARGGDLWAVAADGASPARQLLATPAAEHSPRLSPDGRWVSFTANDTGRYELYVASYPTLRGRRQLSFGGCSNSGDWTEGGRALLFLDDGRLELERVGVSERDGQTRFGAPTPAYQLLTLTDLQGFGFEPRGRRLLGAVRLRKGPQPLRLVTDWAALLERRER